MLTVLANATYRTLFGAQILSLLGTGLTTVALALLAHDLAGADAGQVLGIALAIKMVAYVTIAPFAGALLKWFPRRGLLVGLDLARALFVCLLPFVTEIWQIYALVFVFQAFSAVFTPTFQATIPDILEDDAQYARALSLSRLAYDLEALMSPLMAGLLLLVMTFDGLFVANGLGFIGSAGLIIWTQLPKVTKALSGGGRATQGLKIYFRTPRLRAVLALFVAVAAAGSMVIVNTVVVVTTDLGLAAGAVAAALAAFGAGSMVAALVLPQLLDRLGERTPMVFGAILAGAALLIAPLALSQGFLSTLVLWALIGVGISAIQTPAGLVLKRSCHPEDRPALFAAQFALSHLCWLIFYPLAGWLGVSIGLSATAFILGTCALLGVGAALILWPRNDPAVLEHTHDAMEHAHPHSHDSHHGHSHPEGSGASSGVAAPHHHWHKHGPIRHAHAFVIDDHHPHWPR
ncbi:MAG: MFS transporter [Pseudomonadota bacterium]